MEILVIMFIMFVLSKLFGGVAKQMPQDQRKRGARPFPNIPSEWNFPRTGEVFTGDLEPVPSEEPSRTKSLMVSSQEKQLRKTKEQSGGLKTASKTLAVEHKPELALNNDPSLFRESPLENLLEPENLISGIILSELLQPPKSKRRAR